MLKPLDDELTRASVKTEWYLRWVDVLAASAKKAQLELERALAEANRVLKKRATAIIICSLVQKFISQWVDGRLPDMTYEWQLVGHHSLRRPSSY